MQDLFFKQGLKNIRKNQRRVFAYLRKHGIAPEVINGFIKGNLLYEETQHHNCVL